MSKLAPIAIFTYNRLVFLKILIRTLQKNVISKKSIVYIFSDHWKDLNQKSEVLEVRNYISKICGFKKIIIIYRKKNYGLSKNIISGINFVLKKNKKIIVLEDDLMLSKYFLNFMNDGLNIYNKENKVASIHGWSYPYFFKKNLPNYFFIKGADCWGWATWKRAWKKINLDGKNIYSAIKARKIEDSFNFNNSYDYLSMLKDQIKKKNNSWAIRWYGSMFLENMYTLYPKISFVKNIGTNYGIHSNYDYLNLGNTIIANKYKKISKIKIEESNIARKEIEIFFKKNYLFRLKVFIKKIFKC
jgi:hypothetical protein